MRTYGKKSRIRELLRVLFRRMERCACPEKGGISVFDFHIPRAKFVDVVSVFIEPTPSISEL